MELNTKEMNNIEEDKLKRAKKRVDELKGFYIHLAVFVAVNAFIMINIAIRSMGGSDSFWQFGTFFTPVFWAISQKVSPFLTTYI